MAPEASKWTNWNLPTLYDNFFCVKTPIFLIGKFWRRIASPPPEQYRVNTTFLWNLNPILDIIKVLWHISGFVNVTNQAYWQKLRYKLRLQETPGTTILYLPPHPGQAQHRPGYPMVACHLVQEQLQPDSLICVQNRGQAQHCPVSSIGSLKTYI